MMPIWRIQYVWPALNAEVGCPLTRENARLKAASELYPAAAAKGAATLSF